MEKLENLIESINANSIIDYYVENKLKNCDLLYRGWVVLDIPNKHSGLLFSPKGTQDLYVLNNTLINGYEEEKPSGDFALYIGMFGNTYNFELTKKGQLKVKV